MTCIVGYVEKETVYIGGDSAGTGYHEQTIRKDKKVFKNGQFIMGFTSSFRMGQLLMSSKFKPKPQKKSQDDYDYMITDFIDEVIKCFKDNGWDKKYNDGETKGGSFLVGYKGVLYEVEGDLQVGYSFDNYAAVGCGAELSKGALYILDSQKIPPTKKISNALEAASHFSSAVAAPYNFVSMSKSESEEVTIKQLTE